MTDTPYKSTPIDQAKMRAISRSIDTYSESIRNITNENLWWSMETFKQLLIAIQSEIQYAFQYLESCQPYTESDE
jgi:hypothetical protein